MIGNFGVLACPRVSEHLKIIFYGEKQNPKIYVRNKMILNKMITIMMIFNTKTDHLYHQLLSLLTTVICVEYQLLASESLGMYLDFHVWESHVSITNLTTAIIDSKWGKNRFPMQNSKYARASEASERSEHHVFSLLSLTQKYRIIARTTLSDWKNILLRGIYQWVATCK